MIIIWRNEMDTSGIIYFAVGVAYHIEPQHENIRIAHK